MALHPDPVLARADIARLGDEFPNLEHITVEALYRHWVEIQGRQPEYEEIAAYFRRVGGLHEESLWEELFGIDLSHRGAPVLAAAGRLPDDSSMKRPGRPKGSRSVTRQQIVHTYRSLEAGLGRQPTQAQLASNLEPRIARRTLQDLLAEYGLPWPPA